MPKAAFVSARRSCSAQQPIKLAGGQLCSKCLDDRAGVAAILAAMEQLHAVKDKLKCNVAVLISTQEEVTELGAQTGAFTVQPEYAIAGGRKSSRQNAGRSVGRCVRPRQRRQSAWARTCTAASPKSLIKTAKANDIDYTLEIMEGNTGTNAWTMQIVGRGIANGFAVHSGKIHAYAGRGQELSDVQAVADLMAEFLREFDGEVGA